MWQLEPKIQIYLINKLFNHVHWFLFRSHASSFVQEHTCSIASTASQFVLSQFWREKHKMNECLTKSLSPNVRNLKVLLFCLESILIQAHQQILKFFCFAEGSTSGESPFGLQSLAQVISISTSAWHDARNEWMPSKLKSHNFAPNSTKLEVLLWMYEE